EADGAVHVGDAAARSFPGVKGKGRVKDGVPGVAAGHDAPGPLKQAGGSRRAGVGLHSNPSLADRFAERSPRAKPIPSRGQALLWRDCQGDDGRSMAVRSKRRNTKLVVRSTRRMPSTRAVPGSVRRSTHRLSRSSTGPTMMTDSEMRRDGTEPAAKNRAMPVKITAAPTTVPAMVSREIQRCTFIPPR